MELKYWMITHKTLNVLYRLLKTKGLKLNKNSDYQFIPYKMDDSKKYKMNLGCFMF